MKKKLILSVILGSVSQILFTQGTWNQKASLGGTGRYCAVSFSIGSKGYVGTGRGFSGYKGDFWEWDQAANTWTQKANFIGQARSGATGFSIGTKGYIGTGVSGSSPNFNHHQDFYEWDQATNTWTQKSIFGGLGREEAIGFSIGAKAYIGMGWQSKPTTFSPFFKDFWEWDQATDTWTQKADFGGGTRAGAVAYSTGTKGYAGTGWNPTIGSQKDFWEYDPATNTWNQKASVPGSGRSRAVGFHVGDNGYIGTGEFQNNTPLLSDFYKYDPLANSWSAITSFGGGVWFRAVGFSIGCYGYVATGCLNQSGFPRRDLWEFYDSTNTFCCLLSTTAKGASTICAGQTATLTAAGGNYYSWSNGATAAVITVSPTISTTYTVTETSGICTDTATVSVTVLPSPPVGAISGDVTICAGDAATFSASGGNTYSWNGGQTTSAITTYPNTNVTYTVIVAIGMCADTSSASVSINPLPTPSISGNTSFCAGQSTTLMASGGNSYSWSNGSTDNFISITPAFSGTYSVIATSLNGCTAQASSIVVVTPVPVAVATSNTICLGTTTVLMASGGSNYLWNTGATTAGIQVTPGTSVSYSVIVSNGNCPDTAFSFVLVNPLPVVTCAASNTTITYGQSVQLSAAGGTSYSWNNGNQMNPQNVSPSATTYYCVTATDANTCSDTACITVTFIDVCEPGIYLPNAFSPNNDKENDLLKIYTDYAICVTDLHIVIYGRLGEKVYESYNPSFEWDGLLREQQMHSQVLTYYLTASLINGKAVSKKGNISLIR